MILSYGAPPEAALTASVGQLLARSDTGAIYSKTSGTGNSGRSSLLLQNGNLGFNIGLGTTSPFAKVAIHANNGEANSLLFEIASSTASATSSLFKIDNQGNTTIGGSLTLGTLSGFLKATAGAVTTALVNLASDVSGILPVGNGGTGWTNITAGAIPYGNGSTALATTTTGTAGYVLAYLNGIPTWTATTTLSTISGTLSVGKGGTGQTAFGQGWLNSDGSTISASTSPTVNYLTATSTTATSTFAGGLTGPGNFTVQSSSGRVGIGTASPNAKLNVVDSNGSFLIFNNGSNDKLFARWSFGENEFGVSANEPLKIYTNNAERMRILAGGNVGIASSTPWRTLSVTGTVGFDGLTGATGAGSICLDSNKQIVYNSGSDNCLSSLRLTKHDIQNLNLDALTLVKSLQPVSFIYNNDASSTVRYGFIAEDTASVDAHLATYDAQHQISGVDDRALLAIVVNAVKSLIDKITAFADSFTTKELTFTRATGDEIVVRKASVQELCVGSTCLTESQVQALLNQVGQQPSSPSTPVSDHGPAATMTASSTTAANQESGFAPAPIDAPSIIPSDLPATQ
jgi:hypothetical protein